MLLFFFQTGPVLAVKQTAFDVEPYLHEIAQRLCSEAGQKYQAFTDYDIQIVDVSKIILPTLMKFGSDDF